MCVISKVVVLLVFRFSFFLESSSGKLESIETSAIWCGDREKQGKRFTRKCIPFYIYLHSLNHPTWAAQLLTGRNDSRGKSKSRFLSVLFFLVFGPLNMFRFFIVVFSGFVLEHCAQISGSLG